MAIATTTIALIAVAATVAAAGVGTYAAIAQANAASESAKFNKKVQENNALIAQRNATAAAEQGRYEAAQIRKRNLIIAGKQKAGLLKSGVTLTGSAEDVLYDSAVQGEMDALAAMYTAKVQAAGQTAAAGTARARGELYKFEGKHAKTSGYYSAAGTALSGVGQAASDYGNYLKISEPTF